MYGTSFAFTVFEKMGNHHIRPRVTLEAKLHSPRLVEAMKLQRDTGRFVDALQEIKIDGLTNSAA